MDLVARLLRCVTTLILLQALGCASSFGQESHYVPSPGSGTLNLLLANKKGFVIAADSRRTRLNPRMHWDDSQKLFRVGPRSAMAIAGFASFVSQGSPVDVQVASFFREEFAAREWKSGKRRLSDLRGAINTSIGYQLQLIGALLAANMRASSVNALPFEVLAAEIDNRGRVNILRMDFRPRLEPLGPFDFPTPFYEMNVNTTIVNQFVALSAGMDRIARAILDGNLETQDSRILNYYRARNAGELDRLSLETLEGLAVAILAETKRVTPAVGGEDQVGVFGRNGRVKWLLPPLPSDRQRLLSTILQIGFTFTPDNLTPEEYSQARGKNMVTQMNVSLIQPFEQPFTQVFIANRFREVSVSLDGNVFAGNRFSNVTFLYQGGPFYFQSNILEDCGVKAPVGVPLPPALSSCKLEPVLSIVSDDSVGSPIRAHPEGCVTRDADGRLLIKTKGRQNGQDCKGSRVLVPLFPFAPR